MVFMCSKCLHLSNDTLDGFESRPVVEITGQRIISYFGQFGKKMAKSWISIFFKKCRDSLIFWSSVKILTFLNSQTMELLMMSCTFVFSLVYFFNTLHHPPYIKVSVVCLWLECIYRKLKISIFIHI